jgi:peptidoglycan/LPS O-acetylase OafA/YrhL
MRKPFRQLSALLLIAALVTTATLLGWDACNHLRLTFIHQRLGALSFLLIGASYISLLVGLRRPWWEKLKGLLLGVGFLFWGGEQFLQPGPMATVMDSTVVMIFVLDLSLIILGRLQHQDDDAV